MRLLVGLGNPGPRYATSRHNVGFMALDAIARRYAFGGERSRFHSLVCDGHIDGRKIVAIKPQTFMNLSGDAVLPAVGFYKLSPDDIVVLHDEIDLPLGRVRVKCGGGAAGHNGLRSIDDAIGPDYWRIRIGVGHPGGRERVRSHVLQDFTKEEVEPVVQVIDAIAEAFPLMAAGDADRFRSRVDVILNPPPPKPEPKARPNPGDDDASDRSDDGD